jgi:membrane peptidoglycan carboxypeptidase
VSVTTETCEQVVPEGLANTLANAMSKDDAGGGTSAGAAGSVGWDLPMSGKTGTTENNKSSAFLGFTNQYAAANYIYDDSTTPSELCSFPLRQCGNGNLFGGNEPARTWFTAMKPIANNFGPVALPPTDPRYVDGGPGSQVPTVAAWTRTLRGSDCKEAGFQVADGASWVNSSAKSGTVIGTTSPSGQTIPGSIITIQISNGTPPHRRLRRW